MTDYSFVFNAHPSYIESLYQQYRLNPESVEEGWRVFFKGFEFSMSGNGNGATAEAATPAISDEHLLNELRVLALILGYRARAHLLSTTNPLKKRKNRYPFLELADFKLSEKDLDRRFLAGKHIGLPNATLREIIARLKMVYCGNIGFEFHHIQDRNKRRWLKDRIEKHNPGNYFNLSIEEKKRILEKLNGATIFERFLHTKFVGQKRFSLEGGETTIAALDAMITAAVDDRVEEVVIGMAHRGRLNVLANIMHKTYEQIFSEFEGDMPEDQSFGDGDVKYHLGFSSMVKTAHGKQVYLKLTPNPSHLEAVDPVVWGRARAKQTRAGDTRGERVIPLLVHGDAAFAGQGIVAETLNLSDLAGY
ncbi:MAG: thiamine pyrophosphate-dependent enzyme, partial [Saprospiraceae bacterium]